ncbi:uncharacterized protein [Miscanthus floridulus]|uniref:uncharacterized protein n=1 Tax=Miscanthus floridulus TaxID=154761 RepID=UPI00345A15A2
MHNASPLEDNMGEAEPIVLTSPPTPPPTLSSESDLKVNLEDDLDHETASEEEPEPLPVEERVIEISKEEEHHCEEEKRRRKEEERRHEEEEEHHRQEETERRLAMDAEQRRCRAE